MKSLVVRPLVAAWMLVLALCAAPAAFAIDSGDIVVEKVKGEVHVTMNGVERSVRAGGVLELPATIKTGRDGAIDLRQGATTVTVLNMWCAEGVRAVKLSEVQRLRFANPVIETYSVDVGITK